MTFVFDDTVTHKAWNHGTSDRVVLLFDFARPGYDDMPQDVSVTSTSNRPAGRP
ncbi:aspartyl/asparaginyl beta-hydroxylase domain-containing protein [Micromonospora sp. LOL_015]|uniref:aspartyl/asparaginyl beta-hydroxylase domain-containing protein n=1 Tax=Micromonospora sp. LOL_015 TaxID=3345416 RepID=UPI003A8ADA2E